jgi:hypothetical protein
MSQYIGLFIGIGPVYNVMNKIAMNKISAGSKNKPNKKPAWKQVTSRLILKMEAICSSETSFKFQRITRRHIPEDSTLHNHCCENLKSHKINVSILVRGFWTGLRGFWLQNQNVNYVYSNCIYVCMYEGWATSGPCIATITDLLRFPFD